MPKIKTLQTKKPPAGWYFNYNYRELIEPTLQERYQRMRAAENDPHEGKRKTETTWPILRIHHQMSKYIFDLYRKKEIAKGKFHTLN